MDLKRIYLSIVAFISFQFSIAQIQVGGSIFENETNEPIPFAAVFWGNTTKGFYTNFEGKFSVNVSEIISDTLNIAYGAYEKKSIVLSKQKDLKNITVFLDREVVKTAKVEIVLGINPALKWIELAQKNAEKNNPENSGNYDCEVFSKSILSLNNIGKGLKGSKIGKEIGPLFDTMTFLTGDSTKAILPIFFSEVLSNYAHQKDPQRNKETILASRVKGVGVSDGTLISQLVGSSLIKYNVYNPTLIVLAKGIVSPINSLSKLIYNFKLVGVDKFGPRRLFMIKVTPKNNKDLAFSGLIWVEDTTGAVVRLSLEIDGNSNLNFIDKLRISQEYIPAPVGDGYICNNSRTLLDVAEINTNASGMLASNIISCRNFKTNIIHNDDYFRERIQIGDGELTQSDTFWDNHSHFQQTATEKRIYARIDSVKKLPSITKWIDIVTFLADGYYQHKDFDFGPYFLLASFNKLEGFRNRVGFRTTRDFSKTFVFETFLGYGYADKKFKYGAKLDWSLNRITGTKITFFHSKDVELIGFSDNDAVASEDVLINALNMIGSRSLTYCTSNKIEFNTDLAKGLRTRISLSHRQFDYPRNNEFNLGWYKEGTTDIENSLTNATVTIKLEYEPKAFHLLSSTKRRTVHVPGPVYTLTYLKGLSGVFGSQYDYQRVGLGVSTRKIWSGIGRTLFSIDASKVFGKIPFPLLNIPLGNRAPFYNKRAFNQMDLFEFVTDQNIQISIEHHFNGLFLNKIPFIKKFNLREIISSKAIYGTLSTDNRSLIPQNLPGGTKFEPIHSFDNVPYWETAFGIENIFKVFRIDAIWRMTHRLSPTMDKPNPKANFAIKASLVLGF